jgi:acyl-CoA synthetase (NDP forming)
MVNFFDRCALWPDQVVGGVPERGVALLCQSGTLALNLMFNARSLPIGYVITVGNQARLAIEDLVEVLCDDPRVTAFGMYLEGMGDPQAFARAAQVARAAGKPIALVKAGRSEQAAAQAQTHTGSMTGSDAAFDAFCRQLGIARCDTLDTLVEVLKIMHCGGPLPGRRVLVMGCSGGDMAMTSDVARDMPLEFPPIPEGAAEKIDRVLTGRVSIVNPFDMNTYTWLDPPAQRLIFDAVLEAGYDAVALMLDCPPDGVDQSAYLAVIREYIKGKQALGAAAPRSIMMSSLPETLPQVVRDECLAAGMPPLQGQRPTLEALTLAADMGAAWRRGGNVELCRPPASTVAASTRRTVTVFEQEAKDVLAAHGVAVPARRVVAPGDAVAAAQAIGFPVVLKAAGGDIAHKSERGGVRLNLRNATEVEAAARELAAIAPLVLVEQMVTDGVAEVLVGVLNDAVFGLTLVLGTGGILTELLKDTVTLLPPFTKESVLEGLSRLRGAALLNGFRGRPRGDTAATADAVLAIAAYAQAHVGELAELEVNPLIVRPRGAVVVDALIRLNRGG